MFLLSLIASIIFTGLASLFVTQQTQSYTDAERTDLEDMSLPDISEGVPIAIVFGTAVIDNPRYIAGYDLDTEPIYASTGGGGKK